MFILLFLTYLFSKGSNNTSSADVSLVTGSMLVFCCPTKPGAAAIAKLAGLLLSIWLVWPTRSGNNVELNGFLIKPAKWVKGTKMAYAGLRKEKDRASVIKYLNKNSDSPLQLP